MNAFLNLGYGNDKLILGDKSSATTGTAADTPGAASTTGTEVKEGANWIYKNKEHGMTSAAASIGVLMLWDVEMGLSEVDRFLYSDQDYIKVF